MKLADKANVTVAIKDLAACEMKITGWAKVAYRTTTMFIPLKRPCLSL